MRLKIRSTEDFCSGLMFIVIGVFGFYTAHQYSIGTASSMGPGYFPRGICGIMTILGVALTLRSLWLVGEGVQSFAWRPLIMLSLATVGYGMLMNTAGFIPALAALILLSSLAGGEFKVREVVALIITLVAASWALFIYGLNLSVTLFWWGF